MTMALEINDPNALPGHHQSMREIQRLQINPVIQRDTTLITVKNPDGGFYTLTMYYFGSTSYYTTS